MAESKKLASIYCPCFPVVSFLLDLEKHKPYAQENPSHYYSDGHSQTGPQGGRLRLSLPAVAPHAVSVRLVRQWRHWSVTAVKGW